MRTGRFTFHLILNTDGKTRWEYEDISYWNDHFDKLLKGKVGYNLCNADGYTKLIKFSFDLEHNRIKVLSEYTFYDGFTESIPGLINDYMEGMAGSFQRAFRKCQLKLPNTDNYFFNMDTIVYDDEPKEVWYIPEIEEIDDNEAAYLIRAASYLSKT